ncbi:hypothetical protein [Aulosira sp. FACHB-615]|uniref:hypothetical protein n=1 Tax=Aulosira sp. FACHB-615 TaxID=2692777 RepID=UPI001682856A|nr:hypothetical protein [Aulosira sp. FACHB-615]MBD2491866.1 hypothetical protein [Aulosira sp. FACHB-615]
MAVLGWMRYISTPPPTPPRLRQQMRGGVPTVLQASKNCYMPGSQLNLSVPKNHLEVYTVQKLLVFFCINQYLRYLVEIRNLASLLLTIALLTLTIDYSLLTVHQ